MSAEWGSVQVVKGKGEQTLYINGKPRFTTVNTKDFHGTLYYENSDSVKRHSEHMIALEEKRRKREKLLEELFDL